MADMQAIADALERGDSAAVADLVKKALDAGVSPQQILSDGLSAGMASIGEKFKKNEVYVPEVIIAARAMHAGMNVLRPVLAETGAKPAGTVLLGTVKGDLHDIGKNLVRMMLTGAGFEVIDAGIDVPADKFVELARARKPQIVALSALLTTTMPQMAEVIKALRQAEVQVKVMVGGAPVTAQYAEQIGADGYSPDAASAVDLARKLITA